MYCTLTFLPNDVQKSPNKNVSYLLDSNFTLLYLKVKYAQCQVQIVHLIS